MAVQQRLNNRCAIYGAGNCLPHAYVLQNRIEQIEDRYCNTVPAHLHYEIRPRASTGSASMGRELTATSPEPFSSSSDSVIASGTTEKRTRSILGLGPTQRIALNHDILIDLLAHKVKRPRANRMLPEIASAALRHNANRARRKIREQKIIRALKMKYDRQLVRCVDAYDRGVRVGLGRDHRTRPHGIDSPLHVARGEHAAIVKANTAAQMKDERKWVRLFPSLGQRCREMKAPIARHEPVEQ